jgi:DNA-binding transcriptional ArsR family regulator
MPGGRLTGTDRLQIASGLGAGLGYAEIARRLGRPTSTISREVGRNGGPGRYQADQAHDTSRRRARRRRPASSAEPSAASAYGRDPEAVRAFVDQFATVMAQTGLSRMASRVLVCLFTTDSGALTAAELVQHLRVSPASVSKAVGYLEELELVRRERDARGRRERYIVDDGDVWIRSWIASARKNAKWADAAERGAEILGAATPAGARLTDMGRFFAQLASDMTDGLTGTATDDALTVLAALVHAGAPLAPDQLATALGWPPGRVINALREARSDRLTAVQREALDWRRSCRDDPSPAG